MRCSFRPLRTGIFVAAILLAAGFQASAQAPIKQWDRTYGGTEIEYFRSVQQTRDGGYILGGTSESGIGGSKTQATQGGNDFWIVKLDAAGTKQWDKSFGGDRSDALLQMQQTTDGGYILAGSSQSGIGGDKTQASQGMSDFWIVKVDASGVKQWDKTFGGSGIDYCFAMQQTRDGGYLMGGYSTSDISGDKTQTSRGLNDFWIVKLDASGTKQWDKTFGGSGDDVLYALQQTTDGGYFLGGASTSGISGDKTQANFGSNTVADYWIIRLDANGNKLWDKTFGGTDQDVLEDLTVTADGGCLFGGYSNSGLSGNKSQASRGDYDYWVVKLDANGTKQWDKSIGGAGGEILYSLQQTIDGGYILGGVSASGISGDKTQASRGLSDYWVVKLDPTGVKQWDIAFGGAGIDGISNLRQTSDGGYILGGASESSIGGDKSQGSFGSYDYWVIKTNAAGPLAVAPAVPRQPLGVYPNPAHRHLTLRLPADAPRTNLHLSLLDGTGRVLRRQPLAATAAAEVPVQVGVQATGLYLLRLEGPNGYVVTQRLELR